MIQDLSDIWVFSDMNGTLLDKNMQISSLNLETIRLFTMMGGKFSVSTERTLESLKAYEELLPYLSLSICCGGCSIYDFKTNFYSQNGILPKMDARKALWDILRHFETVGVLIIGEDRKNFQLRGSEMLNTFCEKERISYLACPLDNLPENWNKIVFIDKSENLDQLMYYISKRNYLGIDFSYMSSTRLEMMPKSVNKGSALKRVCDIASFPIENTFAIGNYYDDIDMMDTAGYSVALENSPREVKMVADITIAKNTESGVGQFLYQLIRKYAK